MKTKLFLDSVIIEEIRKYSWLVSGVTTTPTFFKREKIDYNAFISSFRTEFPQLEIHIEALGPTPKETENCLLQITNQNWFDPEKIVIKIPVDFDNLKIVSKYSKKGIKFNTHLIFSTCQAFLAASAGTTYVCPLIGRYVDNVEQQNKVKDDDRIIGRKLLTDIINTMSNDSLSKTVKVMASSIRTLKDFQNSISAGADVITAPTKILDASFNHEYTDEGVKIFLNDMGF